MLLWARETESDRKFKEITGHTPKAQTAALEVVWRQCGRKAA